LIEIVDLLIMIQRLAVRINKFVEDMIICKLFVCNHIHHNKAIYLNLKI